MKLMLAIAFCAQWLTFWWEVLVWPHHQKRKEKKMEAVFFPSPCARNWEIIEWKSECTLMKLVRHILCQYSSLLLCSSTVQYSCQRDISIWAIKWLKMGKLILNQHADLTGMLSVTAKDCFNQLYYIIVIYIYCGNGHKAFIPYEHSKVGFWTKLQFYIKIFTFGHFLLLVSVPWL